jgi:hypothetical protein
MKTLLVLCVDFEHRLAGLLVSIVCRLSQISHIASIIVLQIRNLYFLISSYILFSCLIALCGRANSVTMSQINEDSI